MSYKTMPQNTINKKQTIESTVSLMRFSCKTLRIFLKRMKNLCEIKYIYIKMLLESSQCILRSILTMCEVKLVKGIMLVLSTISLRYLLMKRRTRLS